MTLLVTGGAVFLGGLVRGATGFGGALVMVPLLATVTTPAAAVSLVLLIEVAGYADMLRHAGRRIEWRAIGVLTVAAIVAVPLGVYAVTHVDTAIMTRVIAGCVIALALILMTGWRYTGTPGWPVTVGVGAVSGALDGVAGVPGPPVALFLYGGPHAAQTVRDNLVGYFLLLDMATLVAFAIEGTLRAELLWLGLGSVPISIAANWMRVAGSAPAGDPVAAAGPAGGGSRRDGVTSALSPRETRADRGAPPAPEEVGSRISSHAGSNPWVIPG